LYRVSAFKEKAFDQHALRARAAWFCGKIIAKWIDAWKCPSGKSVNKQEDR
jgi:hypothetical protein